MENIRTLKGLKIINITPLAKWPIVPLNAIPTPTMRAANIATKDVVLILHYVHVASNHLSSCISARQLNKNKKGILA